MEFFKSKNKGFIEKLKSQIIDCNELNIALTHIDNAKRELTKQNKWEKNDIKGLLAVVNQLFVLANNHKLNKIILMRFSRFVVFCSIYSMQPFEEQSVENLNKLSCLWPNESVIKKDFLDYINEKIVPRYPKIACIIITNMGLNNSKSLGYFKNFWHNSDLIAFIKKYSQSSFENPIILSFSEPWFTEYRDLLEWLKENNTNQEISTAAELILGLWYGKFSINKIEILDENYLNIFINNQSVFSQQIAFSLACITQNIDVINGLLKNEDFIPPSWLNNFEPITLKFLDPSIEIEKNKIAKDLMEPEYNLFPTPLYYFMLLVYAVHIAKNNTRRDTTDLYKKVKGPWELWVKQFDSLELPYRPNSDITKYEELIFSSYTKMEIKEFITGWLIESIFWEEGKDFALKKVEELPENLKKTALNRIHAITGDLSRPGNINNQDINEVILAIRYAVFNNDIDILNDILENKNEIKIHEAEFYFCEIAKKYIQNDSFSEEDYDGLKRFEHVKIPYLFWMFSNSLFKNKNYHESIPFFELCIKHAPSNIEWKEYAAQNYALCKEFSKSFSILKGIASSLSVEAGNLYGWCLFLDMFPNSIDLINLSLSDNLDNSNIGNLNLCLNNLSSNNELKDFVELLLNKKQVSDFIEKNLKLIPLANEWLTIQKALYYKQKQQVIYVFKEVEGWDYPFTSDVIVLIAQKLLNQYVLDKNEDQEYLSFLLEKVDITKEEFYYSSLIDDIRNNTEIDMIYKKYHEIYGKDHPVFGKICIYKLYLDKEYEECLSLIKSNNYADDKIIKFININILSITGKWRELLDIIISEIDQIDNKKHNDILVLFAIQVCVVKFPDRLIKFLKIGNELKININDLPKPVQGKLMQDSLNDIIGNRNQELVNIINPLLPEGFNILIDIINADVNKLLADIKQITAQGKWGAYIYRIILKAFMDKIKKQSEVNGLSELLNVLPDIILFIERNKIGIEETEIYAIKNIYNSYKHKEKVIKSLKGILKVDNAEDLLFFSSGLICDIQYPENIKKFSESIEKYTKIKTQVDFEKLNEVSSVVEAWIEFLLQQEKKDVDGVLYPLLEIRTKYRLNQFGHSEFSKWFIEERKKFPDKEQYIDQAKDFLELPLYNWFMNYYFEELNRCLLNNKPIIATMFSKIIQKLVVNPNDMMVINNSQKEFNETIQSFFKDKLDEWIKDKLASLDGLMKPKEEDKKYLDHNYVPGLEYINNLITVLPNRKDVLSLGLFYANKWANNLEQTAKHEKTEITSRNKVGKSIKQIMDDYANNYASQLLPLCKAIKTNEHLMENKALANYFFYKALVENQTKPYAFIEKLMQWESTHDKIFWFYQNRYVDEINSGKAQFSDFKNKMEHLLKYTPQGSAVEKKILQNIQS